MSPETLKMKKIFERTNGRCHLCRRELSFGDYGSPDGWEREHSKPRSKGGTNHLNNLYPACVSCNRQKGNRSNASVRSKHGYTKPPMSKRQRRKRARITIPVCAIVGARIGASAGFPGFVAGGVIGGIVGWVISGDSDD